jgi:adenosylhomocysteine nucleosidase
MPIGIITGMRAEASIARRCTRLVASTGGVALAADQEADALIERGATALMSLGIAGGLADTLPTGTVVVATGVVVRNATIATDADWCARLLAGLPGAVPGLLLGGDRIIGRAAQKAELFRRTGALAVDLESGGVARAAASAGLPFIAVRAIADTASADLPPAALVGLDRRGGVALGAVLGSLWRDPGQLTRLMSTARDTRAALRALARGVRDLGVEPTGA